MAFLKRRSIEGKKHNQGAGCVLWTVSLAVEHSAVNRKVIGSNPIQSLGILLTSPSKAP